MKFFMSLVVVAVCAQVSNASTLQLFLSDKGVGQGPVIANPDITLNVGEVTKLFLWGKTDMTVGGIGVRLNAPATGVVGREGEGTLHNPTFGSFPATQDRWDGINRIDEVDSLYRFNALTVFGLGLDPAIGAADTLYDAATDAYLLGEIDLRALVLGQTNLFLSVSPDEITPKGGVPADIEVVFGANATDRVFGNGQPVANGNETADATITVVPEPTTALVLLGMVLAGLFRRSM